MPLSLHQTAIDDHVAGMAARTVLSLEIAERLLLGLMLTRDQALKIRMVLHRLGERVAEAEKGQATP